MILQNEIQGNLLNIYLYSVKDCYMKEKTKMIANEERELNKYIWEQLKANGRTIFEARTNMIKIGAIFGEKWKRCELYGKEETTESSNAAGHKTTFNQKCIKI